MKLWKENKLNQEYELSDDVLLQQFETYCKNEDVNVLKYFYCKNLVNIFITSNKPYCLNSSNIVKDFNDFTYNNRKAIETIVRSYR